jgi:predicted CopG family antitoxin
MTTKNIAIREDVYDRLLSVKGNNEGFSDTIERLLSRKSSLLPYAGAFREDDEGLKTIEKEIIKLRKSPTW